MSPPGCVRDAENRILTPPSINDWRTLQGEEIVYKRLCVSRLQNTIWCLTDLAGQADRASRVPSPRSVPLTYQAHRKSATNSSREATERAVRRRVLTAEPGGGAELFQPR